MKGTKIKRKIALALAALMIISTVDVPKTGVIKAEETSESTETTIAESMPQTLTVTESSGDDKAIITEGELQDDGIDNNEAAIYQGENWYYDSTTNQLVMDNASIKNIQSNNGDLTVLLYGENTISENFYFYVDDTEKENTLKIKGCDNKGSLTVVGEISDGNRLTTPFGTVNLNITDATIKTSLINCEGSLVIENSEVIVSGKNHAIDVNNGVTITNSYIEAIASDTIAPFLVLYSGCVVSDSQIVIESGRDFCDAGYIDDHKRAYNSIITTKWKESGDTVAKTNVYGIASLKKDLTLERTDSINFYDWNGRIANMEMFSAKDGAGVFIHDSEHKHNTDGGVRYTWKNDSEHTKGLVCRNCPIAYVAEETEAHSTDDSGICVCSKAYQPALLTTDKYDMDNDGVYDRVYEISNAAQLYWFADKINNENYTSGNINAVLTADIVVNENVLRSDGTLNDGTFTDWTPIGMWAGDDEYYYYLGIFDGQNHTISGLYFKNIKGDMEAAGLFGYIGSSGKVSNVSVLDSYFSTYGHVGGVCGDNDGTIIDCYNTGNVSGDSLTGGVCGENYGTIINCYNTGSVSGTSNYRVGDVCGYNYSTVTNCYYLSDTESDNKDGTVGKTKDQFANGEVAYLLQADRTEDVWGQTIGTDTYPTLGGKKVYQNKEYDSCDENGNILTITYANEQENKFTHTVAKVDAVGYCTKEGTDTYWKCSKCGKMFSDENAKNEITSAPVLAPSGHDYGLSVETSEDGTKSSVVFTCQRKGCEENDEGHSETVTITAPDKGKLIFDGITKEATVTRTSQNLPENIPNIVYTGDDLLNGKPVNAGTYKASITIGDGENEVTASITYEIAQATPVIGTVSADALNDTLDVSKVELKRSDNTLSGTLKLKDDTKLEYGTNEYTYVFTPHDSNYKQIESAVSITVNDTIAPTASYRLGTDGWKKFINTITFGKFCKDYQTMEITYSDKAADGETDGSGIAKKQYYISDKEIENAQSVITDDMWMDYTKKVHLDANGTYFIYVRVSDNAGNEIIQNSEGVVIYAESTISPAESEYIYKEGKNCEFSVVLNGNTFNRLTDETGKDLAADSYTIGTDGKLTMKAAYLDTLKPGEYTYKLYMNPQGVATDKVELVYTFTVTVVKQAEITVTGASAEDRPYDSTSNKVNISAVTISGVRDGEDVSIDTANLQGTLSSANAGSYTEVVLPQLTLIGADAANYKLVQPDGAVTLSDKVTISKLDSQITIGTESYDKTYGDAAFLLDATKNNTESEIIYTVTSGADVVSVDNGMVTIKKAGTATIKLSLAESQNYNVAEDKAVTVNAVKKSGYTVDALERSYLYLRENRESIDLAGLLPSDCGNVTYGNPVTSGDVTYSVAPKIENGVLSYTVGKGTAGNEGTVQTTVVTDNYADIMITVHTKLVDQIPVKAKSGTEVTLKNSVITYGEALSEMLFDDAVFVDIADGKTVKGTLSWKDPAYKPNAGTASATWIFTPDSEDYAPLEGEISITVRKAVPQATAIPTVAERVYDPSKVLIDSDITGGTVTDVNGDPLAGKWSWQSAGITPVVENEGYIAVFTPEDTANYEQISKTITVKVKKATPVITEKPSAEEITYGDSLGKSTLTGGNATFGNSDAAIVSGEFIWKNVAIKPVVVDSNSKAFTIVFIPTDAANYETVETEITVSIRKAPVAPDMPGDAINVSNGTKKVSEISLPENWVWQEADKDTALEVGVAVKATAVYVGADKGNYETESVTISITRSTCDHSNIELRNTTEATCENTGYTGDTYCTDCGIKLANGTTTAALGHSYTSKITKEPTTKEEGEMTYTCSRCGDTYTKAIEKLPDNDDTNNGDTDNSDTNNGDTDNSDTNNGDTDNSDSNNDDNKGKPYIKDDNEKSGWKLITEQVEAAKTGETVTVEMNGTTTVPSDLFEQIKGKDINVVFDMDNGIKWTVNGKDVIEIKGDIDFGVTFGTEAGKTIPVDVINSITGEHTSMNLTLAYSGEFGFTATLTINLKKENAGYYANLYYYNPDSNKLEFVCAGQIGKDGNVNLTFTHASDYTIVISDTAMDVNKTGGVSQNTDKNKTTEQNSKSETPKTGDAAWRSWWIILLGMGIIVVDVGKAARRRNRNN